MKNKHARPQPKAPRLPGRGAFVPAGNDAESTGRGTPLQHLGYAVSATVKAVVPKRERRRAMNATAIGGNRITDAGTSAPGGFAQDVANHYLRMISAYWRGNDSGMVLESWLARHRTPELPPRTTRTDDAFSLHGGGGHGIHWIEA